MVGKVRLALAPRANHWWSVPLYVNSVGLTTSLMPYRGYGAEITFDFIAHKLWICTPRGDSRSMSLEPRSVADFHAEFRVHLGELGEFVLPYRAVRMAGDPDSCLLEFLASSYDAASSLAAWPERTG